MSILLEVGRSVGLAGLAGMLVILGALSGRLGAVLKTTPAHRAAHAGAGLVGLAAVTNLLRAAAVIQPASVPAWLREAYFEVLMIALPLTLGLLAGVWVGWHYWRWLLSKR